MSNTVSKNNGFSPARLGRISALMQRYMDDGKLAGVIATVARHGQTAYMIKFGMMDIEAHKSMEFDAIFRIASMTKPITSVAIMMLYEEGHFHLNTPISNFIPGFKNTKVFVRETDDGIEVADLERPLTFRHLFTHTAGLSYGWNENDPVDRQYQKAQKQSDLDPRKATMKDLVHALTTLPLAFQPGTKWRYSYAIDVLGYLVEVISGKPLNEFLKERLFEPLGMIDTDFYVPEAKADRLCALYGHPNSAEKLELLEAPAHSRHLQKPSFLSGGGGLVSTAHDYARFAQMLVNGGELDGERILSPTTVALYSINHMPEAALPYGFAAGEDLYHWGYGYSLGTRVLMDVSKSGLAGSVGEFGWDGAFSTYVWIDPTEALYGLMMLQHAPNAYYPIAQQFKQLTYQALV